MSNLPEYAGDLAQEATLGSHTNTSVAPYNIYNTMQRQLDYLTGQVDCLTSLKRHIDAGKHPESNNISAAQDPLMTKPAAENQVVARPNGQAQPSPTPRQRQPAIIVENNSCSAGITQNVSSPPAMLPKRHKSAPATTKKDGNSHNTETVEFGVQSRVDSRGIKRHALYRKRLKNNSE